MKKILCVLLVVLMCLTAMPLGCFADLDLGVTASALNATGKCGENATYTFSATGELVISGTGAIYADAFRENIEIKNIIIGDNITKVSAGAFDLCCNLESVCFGDSITEIEYFGFGACSSLTVVALSKDLTIIGDKAFQYCSNLERVILFDNVTSINYQAFFDCFSLESINIPKKVAHIGEGTFRNCYALTDIYYEGSEDEWNKIDIGEKNTGLYNATIHYNATMPYNCEHKNPTIVYKVQPTCINNGMKAHYFCSECNSIVMPSGESYKLYINGITIPATGHEWIHASCTTPKTCNKCGVTEGEALGHTFTAQKIGAKYLKSESTCGKQAVYYYSCAVCGASSAETNDAKTFNYGTAPEHTWGPAQTIPATCTEPEMKVQTCTRCGQKYAKKGSGIALGHDMDEVAAKEATCKEDGNNKYYACDRCDKYFKDAEGYIETTVAAETIAKTEHKFTKYNLVKDATCEANAVEKATCDVCKEATHERPMPGTMLAHTFKDYKSDGNATCKADGTMTAVCEMCKEAKDTKTEVDSHKNAPHTPDAAGGRCTLCGEMLVCLHTYSADKLITKTPTCTDEGQKAIVCSKCNANKPGSEEVIPELGHDFEITTKASDATCTEDGKTFSGKCKRCSFIEVGKTIPALGHLFTTEKVIIKAPTCTAEGKKAIRCERCHAIEPGTEEVIPATHSYPDKWSVVIAPDCQNTGVAVKVCFSCHDVIAQTVPKAGHADLDGDSKCDTCEMIIVVEPEEPTDPDTPNEPEEKPCDCDCHAGGIKAFFFKLINFFAKIFDKSARVCKCGASH